jgi:hypothetical protein
VPQGSFDDFSFVPQYYISPVFRCCISFVYTRYTFFSLLFRLLVSLLPFAAGVSFSGRVLGACTCTFGYVRCLVLCPLNGHPECLGGDSCLRKSPDTMLLFERLLLFFFSYACCLGTWSRGVCFSLCERMEEIDECGERRGSRLIDAMKSLYMRLRVEYVLTKRRVMTVASI